MASNSTVIATSISIDTAAATKSMNELNTAIKESKKALGDAKIGSDEYKKAQSQLKEQEDQLQKSLKTANGEKGKSAEAFGTLKEKVQGLIPGLKGAESGVSSFGTQLKLLAANPIILILILIVGALAFLYEAFTSTSKGAKQMEQIFAGVSAVIDNIANRAIHFGKAIISFLSGDFKGASNEFHAATGDILKDMADTYKGAVDLKKKRQELNRDLKESELKTLIQKERLADLKAQLADEDITAKQKIIIAQKLKEEQAKLSKEQTKNAKNELDISLKETAFKYGVTVEIATKTAELQKQLLGDVGEEEKKIIRASLAELTGHAENQMDFTSAIKESIKSNHETMKVISDEDRAVNKAARSANKQMKAEDKAENQKAAEEKKARIADLRDFTLKDLKLKQELELAAISDAKKKELKIIENAYQDELRANRLSLEEKLSKEKDASRKKILIQQAEILNVDYLNVANAKKKEVEHKFSEEKAKKDKEAQEKEIDATRKFEADLNKIELEIKLAGITDIREKERVQLEISFADKFKQAEETYKNDVAKLGQMRTQLFIQQDAAQKAMEKKFAEEDAKKKNELDLKQIAQQLKNKKLAAKTEIDLIKERQKIEEEGYDVEIKAANNNLLKLRDIGLRKVDSEKANSEAIKDIKKKEVQATVEAADAVAGVLENAANLLGKQTAIGKTLAIASATISMFTSAQKAYESALKVPIVGLALAPISAGLAIATGIKNIQSIASVEVPGQSGGGTVPSTPSAPLAPTVQQTSTSLNASSIQGVGNAAAQGVGRVFVLDSDIKNSAERQNRLVRAARLG